jgi:hypothetical protein
VHKTELSNIESLAMSNYMEKRLCQARYWPSLAGNFDRLGLQNIPGMTNMVSTIRDSYSHLNSFVPLKRKDHWITIDSETTGSTKM